MVVSRHSAELSKSREGQAERAVSVLAFVRAGGRGVEPLPYLHCDLGRKAGHNSGRFGKDFGDFLVCGGAAAGWGIGGRGDWGFFDLGFGVVSSWLGSGGGRGG